MCVVALCGCLIMCVDVYRCGLARVVCVCLGVGDCWLVRTYCVVCQCVVFCWYVWCGAGSVLLVWYWYVARW